MSGHGEEISVLHVDDDPDLGDLVAVHLEQTHGDISVCTERSAADGLARLSEHAFDCVVSDHDMPGMDGLEFLRVVREEYEELPFILFTGKGSEEIASDAISAGVTEYLQKGVGTDQYAVLANRIERAVGEQRAKTALEESERMLSTLISNLPGMVYRARNEPDWPMEFVSDGAAELVGYSSTALESGDVSWGTLIEESETERLWETVQTCIAADEPFEVSYKIETADGETRWMWERGRVVDTDDDGVEILEGFITDVTAREERERELADQRAFTEKLIDSIDDMFYVVSTDGSLVRWNDTVPSGTGYTNEKLASIGIDDLIVDSDHDKLWRIFEETLGTGYGTIEAGVETADGEQLQYEFKGSLIEDERGDPFGIAGIGRDITERKRRERELREYRTLVENVGDPMYVLDRDGTIEMVNEAMAVHLGYDRSEIIGSEPARFMPDADVEEAAELIRDLLDDEKTWASCEIRTISADGTVRINEDRIAPLFDEDGTFDGSVGVMRETTERKQRKRELERYETIIEAVGDPVYTLDDEGVFTYANEAIERLTGFEPDALIGEHISTIMAGDDIDRGSDLIRTMLSDPTRQNVTFETDIVDQNGEYTPIEIHIALLPAADGEFNGTAGVIRDISDRKERERQLAEFASVVSHDLRNPLNVVKGRISVARTSGDVSHLEAAASAADRMDDLINDLLTLARQGETVGETTMVDLAALAGQAWADVETGEARLEKHGTATVEADAARLRAVFENLFRNSVEHGSTSSRSGTDDSVEHGTPADDDAPMTVSVGTTDDGFYVADDGDGIPPEERQDVFGRGYTTSDTGTGFGLAIVAEVAQAHGWSVSVTESESGGARFEFTTCSER
ncbi:PAS domain S-box protein [Haloarcula rubripromontorii]|uniref:histidine kinase n=1 Tax=Haloarcula rubripromontorii TaxID=1705562 RepID=A0A847U4F1_9EURY|nr:PAS domain S-box protein [Haloarcula rubripromontorii]NLV05864.1 PAS domain S-box protein [Haloarcula rubripromontorii]